jgi:pyruvate carboxylase
LIEFSLSLLLTTLPAEADEAYVIGKRGQYTPVGAYLAGDEFIKIAVEHGAQLIHPGQILPLQQKGAKVYCY